MLQHSAYQFNVLTHLTQGVRLTPTPLAALASLPRIQGRAKTGVGLLPSSNSGGGRGWGQK